MSTDDDKTKTKPKLPKVPTPPRYRQPENYSTYGRPGTNEMGPSSAPRTISLGNLPLRTGDLPATAKSDWATRFAGKGTVAEKTPVKRATLVEPQPTPVKRATLVKLPQSTPVKRTTPPKRTTPRVDDRKVYSGGPNDPRVQEATPSSSTAAAKRLVYSEGRAPDTQSDTSPYDPKVNYKPALTKVQEAKAAKEIADARAYNQSYKPTTTTAEAKPSGSPTKKTKKHAYDVTYK